MSKKDKVIWADIAEADLKNIIEYIADESIVNGRKVINKIKEGASNLFILPERGCVVPEFRDQGILQYRELICSPGKLSIKFQRLKFMYYRYYTLVEILKIFY